MDIYFLNEKGITQRQLAIRLDCAKTTIFRAIRRGKDLFEQWNTPYLRTYMGGLGSPAPQCDHPKIEVGDDYVCVVCCVSGYDTTDSMRVTTQDINKINGIPEPPKEEKSYAQRKFGGRGQEKKRGTMKLSATGKSAVGEALKQDAAASGITITPAEIQAILQVVEVLLPIIISIFAKPSPAPAPTPSPAKP